MDIHKGHETVNFDPDIAGDVERVTKLIKDKLRDGFYVFAQHKNGSHTVLKDPATVTDKDIEEVLVSDVKARLISPPVTGG